MRKWLTENIYFKKLTFPIYNVLQCLLQEVIYLYFLAFRNPNVNLSYLVFTLNDTQILINRCKFIKYEIYGDTELINIMSPQIKLTFYSLLWLSTRISNKDTNFIISLCFWIVYMYTEFYLIQDYARMSRLLCSAWRHL